MALADDLHRYLDGEPIKARPPGILRRTWMTMRKRPLYALLAFLLTLSLILGVIDYARSRNVFKGFTWEEVRRIWDLIWSDPPTKPSSGPRQPINK